MIGSSGVVLSSLVCVTLLSNLPLSVTQKTTEERTSPR